MDTLNALGKPMRISASAADTWIDCKRKWAYSYYYRIAQPKHPSAEVGTEVHDVLETYLDIGEKPEDTNNRYWRIAEPGLQFLPEVITDAPNPGNNGVGGNWLVEEWVKCQCGPLPFVGKVDLYNLVDFDNIQIDDHKTTGDSSWRWAKTPNQLAKLLQPHAYAWSIIKVHGLDPPESVDFRHIYYATKGEPKSMEVRARNVPWSDVEETWSKLEVIATQMVATALHITEPEDVAATTTSCKKYGGCAYSNICAASPINRDKIKPTTTTTVKRDKEMSDRLTALRAQLGLGNNNTPAQPSQNKAPPKPVQDPQGDAQGLADRLLRAMHGGTDIPIAAAEAMARSADVHLYEAMQLANLRNTGGILRNKVQDCVGPIMEVPAQKEEEESAGTGGVSLFALQISRGEDVAQVLTQWDEYLEANGHRMSRQAAQVIIREATGAQRVRMQRLLQYIKEFNEAYVGKAITLQGNVITLVEGEPAAVVEEAVVKEAETTVATVTPSFDASSYDDITPLGRIVKELATPTIYIDCIPEDPAGVYSFTDFVRKFEQEVEQEGGKVSDSFTQPLPYYGLLDYGQGPKRVAGKVLAALHHAGPQLFKGDMYVDGKHPLADEIVPILRRLKGVRVVRASR